MKKYKVMLSRAYHVTIDAENEDEAKFLTEFFLGDCEDSSNEKDREEKRFYIEEIEPVENNAIEVLQIEN